MRPRWRGWIRVVAEAWLAGIPAGDGACVREAQAAQRRADRRFSVSSGVATCSRTTRATARAGGAGAACVRLVGSEARSLVSVHGVRLDHSRRGSMAGDVQRPVGVGIASRCAKPHRIIDADTETRSGWDPAANARRCRGERSPSDGAAARRPGDTYALGRRRVQAGTLPTGSKCVRVDDRGGREGSPELRVGWVPVGARRARWGRCRACLKKRSLGSKDVAKEMIV